MSEKRPERPDHKARNTFVRLQLERLVHLHSTAHDIVTGHHHAGRPKAHLNGGLGMRDVIHNE